jgi:hypothetical protein
MRYTIPTIMLFALFACKSKEEKNDKNPRALQDKSIDVSVLSKRTNSDLLDNLYDELEDKNPTLKALGEELAALQKMKNDTNVAFKKYDEKSKSYYQAAARHFQGIKDSALRVSIKKIIDSSMLLYAETIAPHKGLLKNIDSSNISLNDLFAVLKIIKTLPMIADYQKNNLPDSASLLDILTRYQLVGTKLDSVTNSSPGHDANNE